MCQIWETDAAHERLQGRPPILALEPAGPCGLVQQQHLVGELQVLPGWYRDGVDLNWCPTRAAPGFEIVSTLKATRTRKRQEQVDHSARRTAALSWKDWCLCSIGEIAPESAASAAVGTPRRTPIRYCKRARPDQRRFHGIYTRNDHHDHSFW